MAVPLPTADFPSSRRAGVNSARRLVVVVVVQSFALLGACSAASQELDQEVDCCQVTVRSTGVRLGDQTGPGVIRDDPLDVFEDSGGRLWLAAGEIPPMVFDSTGAFIGTVGRIESTEPQGERLGSFQRPTSFLEAGDSVLVIDSPGRAGTVVAPDLTPTRRVELHGPISRGVTLSWPDSVVIASPLRTPNEIGWPLHLVDLGGQLAEARSSFGSTGGYATPEDFSRGGLSRHLIGSMHGGLLTAERYAVIIRRYRADHVEDGRPMNAGVTLDRTTSRARVTTIMEDSLGQVYAFWSDPLAALEEGRTPQTMVAVFAPASAEPLVIQSVDGVIFDTVTLGLVALVEFDERGRFFVRIVRVGLERVDR